MSTTCTDCVAAGLRAKAHGFRDWRTGYACYECAAFDLDSLEGRETMACVTPQMMIAAGREMALCLAPKTAALVPMQLDLFAA